MGELNNPLEMDRNIERCLDCGNALNYCDCPDAQMQQDLRAEYEQLMSRPQNATVAAPDSPASTRTGTRSNPATIGAQNGARLTGTCKECRGPVWLWGGTWIHDGFGYWVHLIRTMKARGV